MNIKLSVSFIAITTALYGCVSTTDYMAPPPPDPSPTVIPDYGPIKSVGDGSHLIGLSMTRDFILESREKSPEIDTNFQEKGSKGSKKIFSIKPTGSVQPRAVILLENRMLPSSTWKIWEYNWNVRRKNIEICEGFMNLPQATTGTLPGSQQTRDNEVITFMPAKTGNENNLPKQPKDCSNFISKGYDYESSTEELLFVLKDNKKMGKSPYLAVYESPTSPYSSMILSLGTLSPQGITELGSRWPELITSVYKFGDSIDPTIGIAVMLHHDESLQRAEDKAAVEKMEVLITGATCGGKLVGSTLTLGALLATEDCFSFIEKAAWLMGYKVKKPIVS